jgi:pimeloyl-ACP methyl ester carboxylesterase
MRRICHPFCLSTIVLCVILACSAPVAVAATDDLPAEGKLVSLNGMEMYYEVHGQGEPLVMLHFFAGSGEIWKPYIPAFSKHYRLIIPDLRGHGRSSILTTTFNHRQSALDVFALLDSLKIKEFRGIGCSSGGMTLLHMATQQPDRVKSMALVGAASYWGKESREHMRKETLDSLTDEDWRILRSTHKHGDAQIRAIIQQFNDFKDVYDDMNFTSPFLSTIKAKTLIMHGDRDKYFPVEIPLEMYRSIPNSYLWIVPSGGHLPLQDNPQGGYTETLLQFFRGEWEGKNAPR